MYTMPMAGMGSMVATVEYQVKASRLHTLLFVSVHVQAKLLSDVNKLVTTLITLRSLYPTADVSSMVSRAPRLLLQDHQRITSDAQQVSPAQCTHCDLKYQHKHAYAPSADDVLSLGSACSIQLI
jgi:hypothetical protein